MAFIYLSKAQIFLAERVDENSMYTESIKVFELIVGRNETIGDSLKKFLPVSVRLFKAIVPGIEILAFSYNISSRKGVTTITVWDVCFLKDLIN